MRILSKDVFNDVVQECTRKQYLSFCIVMRTAERKRELRDYCRRNGRSLGVHVHGDVVVFSRSASKIHICCLANRPKNMYDELIFDDLIADEHAMQTLLKLERQIVVRDLGPFETSTSILEYIGELSGTT